MADITPLPARGERNAPKFDPDYEEQLPTFFDEFQDVATKAGILNDDGSMKKECLRYVDSDTMHFWRSLGSFKDNTKTWKDFKTEVLTNYPDALQTAEVTLEELKKVISEHAKLGITLPKALAKYHRSFSTIASSLMDQGVLSAVQVSRHYVEVLPEQVKTRLDTRLQVQYPNKKKGEAFTLSELKGAIDYLLSVASTATLPGSFAAVTKTEPAESNVERHLQSLTEAITKLASGTLSTGSRPPRSSNQNSQIICRWNNCVGHIMRDCPDLADWLSKGRVELDARGVVHLKGGNLLPADDKYRTGTLKERFTRYFDDHPSEKTWILEIGSPRQPPAPAEYAGVTTALHSNYTLAGMQGPSMALHSGVEVDGLSSDEMEVLKRLLFKVETRKSAKKKAEGSDSQKDTSSSVPQESESPPKSTSQLPDPEPSQPISGRIQQPAKPPRPVIGKLPEGYEPPKDRVMGAPPKDDSRNYKYKSPIETDAAIERVIQAGLASTVTISQADLLAIAPDYRRRMKDSVTSRRVGINAETTSNSLVVEDPVESFLLQNPTVDVFNAVMNGFGDAKAGDKFFVAKDSQSIRAVNAIVGERVVHSILDSGCSIVAMSDAACNALHLMFDESFRIPVQSANGDTDWTLGLARNVPFKFGDVTAFLQVHIVPSPAYDVLLGRPFDILTQSIVRNFLSGDQHISLHDPNTHKNVTIPTLPREPPYFRMAGY
ncbi:hypothetical protein PQX77_018348 [Marasmius sp. AFHP31]|nr:hypothetical protein PQX77_018348 [Marasmius sp. AFHP31]